MADQLKTSEAPAQPGHNGYDPDKLQSFVERIENVQGQIDGIMDEAKERCSPLRDDIKEIKDEAHDATGIPKSLINATLRERRQIAKANAVREKLNEDQRESYDQIKHALGMMADLPLGEAALSEAAE